MKLWKRKRMVVLECPECDGIQDPKNVECTGRCIFCGNEHDAKGVSA